ncbi:unnamed protein product [Gongylonema pulchrum]|uniref:Cse1 domain-containing protein n=1 Tax=Gongylonema pulchrum TaxID=637853 RepID=A0A183EUB6_9BILA|nr:unnamed protein product [Gongylonema pulchrum]
MSLLQCIGQLIYEEWYDVAMPELIETCSAEIENVDLVKNTLSLALGIIGSVQKKRREFWKDNIRICLDSVEQLGHFITASVSLAHFRYSFLKGEVRTSLIIAYLVLLLNEPIGHLN